ncbi:hypothetical protein SALWKB2_1770 [Snodgrassella alvi wkB2]|nr:hypothetical protein SALWKB2_1770 [Snodgrassella alvi wkB2]
MAELYHKACRYLCQTGKTLCYSPLNAHLSLFKRQINTV